MAVVIRLCKQCHRPFPSKTQRAIYCSPACNAAYHMQKKRQLINLDTINPQQPTEDQSMKEQQKQRDTADHLRAFIAKHMHHMTPEQVAEELQVPLFAVKLHWPNPAR